MSCCLGLDLLHFFLGLRGLLNPKSLKAKMFRFSPKESPPGDEMSEIAPAPPLTGDLREVSISSSTSSESFSSVAGFKTCPSPAA